MHLHKDKLIYFVFLKIIQVAGKSVSSVQPAMLAAKEAVAVRFMRYMTISQADAVSDSFQQLCRIQFKLNPCIFLFRPCLGIIRISKIPGILIYPELALKDVIENTHITIPSSSFGSIRSRASFSSSMQVFPKRRLQCVFSLLSTIACSSSERIKSDTIPPWLIRQIRNPT